MSDEKNLTLPELCLAIIKINGSRITMQLPLIIKLQKF